MSSLYYLACFLYHPWLIPLFCLVIAAIAASAGGVKSIITEMDAIAGISTSHFAGSCELVS